MNQLPVGNGNHVDAGLGDGPRREKTILIADDDPMVVRSLSQRLQRRGYRTCSSSDATRAILDIEKTLPDLVILDIQMPAGNGIAVCEMLACNRQCANIPIVIHSVITDEAVKRRCRQFGTHYVEKSPRSAKDIETLVESLLADRQLPDTGPNLLPPPIPENSNAADSSQKVPFVRDRELHSVLCIEDNPVMIRSVAMRLQPYGIQVKGVDNGEQGCSQAAADSPDLILLDLNLPGRAGNHVLKNLKTCPDTKDIPVIVLTMETTAGVQRQILALGAVAFLTKPVHWPRLFAEMGRCIRLPKQLLIDCNLPDQTP
jgi:CheY-like chemotaxis protein